MTTRKAIGSYRLDATDDEKIYALYLAVEDAAYELHDLQEPYDEIMDRFTDAVERSYSQ